MSPPGRQLTSHVARFPRVSGDEPDPDRFEEIARTFSPRERG